MTVKEPGRYTQLDSPAQTLFAADSLVIYRQLLQDEVLTDLRSLLMLLALGDSSAEQLNAAGLYCSVCSKLFNAGMGLKEYISNKLIHSENCFSRAAGINGAACLDGALKVSVRHDFEALHKIASLKPELLKGWISGVSGSESGLPEAVKSLPEWPDKRLKLDAVISDSIHTLFMESGDWGGLAERLAGYHFQHGSGIFSEYMAFVWKHGGNGGGCLEGVESPDPVSFAELVSYEMERSMVIENTEQFLAGHPANNILLYGTKGTGKSATVKALLNEYGSRGLRMIEVPKKHLADFPEIIRQLSGRGQKFILFIDDLAFEDNEENYTAIKAALEGGLERKPDNVLVYATSNRSHLIKERFSDRAGFVSGEPDDEVHAADTMQEKLSLSDRFGITVVFTPPDKKKYLDIVDGIAEKRGLGVDKEYLHREALKWELRFNGRSPRTARQFVDWLEGTL